VVWAAPICGYRLTAVCFLLALNRHDIRIFQHADDYSAGVAGEIEVFSSHAPKVVKKSILCAD
jgi:hypothetical protein